MTEQDLQDQVVQLARSYGWLVYHVRGNTRNQVQGNAGFPDCILVRGSRMLAVELKAADGKVGPLQERWLLALSKVDSVRCTIWRPADLPDIIHTLAG